LLTNIAVSPLEDVDGDNRRTLDCHYRLPS
jgi:hypothetical protein